MNSNSMGQNLCPIRPDAGYIFAEAPLKMSDPKNRYEHMPNSPENLSPQPLEPKEAPKPADVSAPPPTTDLSSEPIESYRGSLAAMTPKGSESATKAVPDLVIDEATARALTKIDGSDVHARIASGGGPYQALRPHFTQGEISDQDLSKASVVIRDHRMSGHNLKTGEAVPTGSAFQDQDDVALNNAELRGYYGLSYKASDAQLDAAQRVRLEADIRKGYGLPANATEAQVDAKRTEQLQLDIRKGYGLPPTATEAEVEAKRQADLDAYLAKTPNK